MTPYIFIYTVHMYTYTYIYIYPCIPIQGWKFMQVIAHVIYRTICNIIPYITTDSWPIVIAAHYESQMRPQWSLQELLRGTTANTAQGTRHSCSYLIINGKAIVDRKWSIFLHRNSYNIMTLSSVKLPAIYNTQLLHVTHIYIFKHMYIYIYINIYT